MESSIEQNLTRDTQDNRSQTNTQTQSFAELKQPAHTDYCKITIVLLSILVVLLGLGLRYFATKESMPELIVSEPESSMEPTTVSPTAIPTQVIEITPTQTTEASPTLSWKTYTNSEIGFSLHYPQHWVQTSSTPPRVVSFKINSNTPSDFFIAYHENIDNMSQWLIDNQAGKIIGTTDLNGNRFTVIESELSLKSKEYAINIGNNSYLRLVFEPFPNDRISDETINLILSTFEVSN